MDRHIESGGYGDVYLGHNHSTGEDVAVKIGEERSIEVIFFNYEFQNRKNKPQF